MADKKYLRKFDVAERYGVTPRHIERLVEEKRLPPPEYPTGQSMPLWDQQTLDRHDRAMVRKNAAA
jgi:hypothetical protein